MTPTATPTLRQLLQVYMKIGLLGFGGGFAVLAFIRSEVVDRNHWVTPEQFDHMVEMSAFAPGPTTTNVLAAIAYRLRGWRGLIVGTFSVLWPSFLLILVLAKLTAVLHDPWITGALRGMEIAVVGLLVDVIWTLWQDVPHRFLTVAVAVVAGGLTWIGLNPALIVVSAAVFAYLQFRWQSRTRS
ncbi:MAG: chromate transporter [Sulfobacillus acidophilus]|uniref:Chromate transporter n=1 Tax=Sulfobacillus acidophilus TaxID=53633 RepID=A0A2T2WIY3_9FIRM|nr:MAG: chromate transporter [Sulfobacillus acidophilus]